jgi:hypothetical protein
MSTDTSTARADGGGHDLPELRAHIRLKKPALAGFMELGAGLEFAGDVLRVIPRNDIYVPYLNDNKDTIAVLATEFHGRPIAVELAPPQARETLEHIQTRLKPPAGGNGTSPSAPVDDEPGSARTTVLCNRCGKRHAMDAHDSPAEEPRQEKPQARPTQPPPRSSNPAVIKCNTSEIRRALTLLCEPGAVYELRGIDTHKATAVGYFTDLDKLAKAAVEICDRHSAVGTYITINPLIPELLARADNRVEYYVKKNRAARDEHVIQRRWLPVDIDARTPAEGISSSDGEHTRALARAGEVREFLTSLGWSDPIQADSGNGGHLVYSIDLPNDDASRDLLSGVLQALASRFSDNQAKLDTTVFNASRIWKLYGSVARKGSSMSDRPHRLARIITVPNIIVAVTREQLEAVAAMAPAGKAKGTSGTKSQAQEKPAPEEEPDRASDTDAIDQALTARNGDRFQALYTHGDLSDYDGDHSRADYALCSMLAFYTGPNRTQLDRLFRNSALFRADKWDERHDKEGRTYGDMTIAKAIAGKTEFFDWSRGPKYQRTHAEQVREPPRALHREIPAASPFPVNALGEIGSAAARNIQAATQAAMAICAQSTLAVMNLCAMGHVDIELPTGECEPTSEFFATLAESGERKTSADERALAPVRQFENDHEDQYLEDKFAWKDAMDVHEKGRQEILGNNRKPNPHAGTDERKRMLKELGTPPEAPITNQIIIGGDPTPEGTQRFYREGGACIAAQFTSEGATFVGGYSMSEEAKRRTAGFICTLFDGLPLPRVRGGEGFGRVRGRRMAMHILIQPLVAQALFNDTLLEAQGLLSRILAVAPESTAGNRAFVEVKNFSAISTFSTRACQLLEQPFTYLKSERPRDGLAPPIMQMDSEARRLWINFSNEIDGLTKQDARYYPVKGLASKAAEHAARLAATITFFEFSAAMTLNASDMEKGISLVRYYLNEALRIREAAAVDQDLELAGKLLHWLQTTWDDPNGLVSLPDCYQIAPIRAIRTKKRAAEIVELLVSHGWLEPHNACQVRGTMRRDVWRVVK